MRIEGGIMRHKPCKKCGSRLLELRSEFFSGVDVWIECQKCGEKGPERTTLVEEWEAWDRRA
jgi:hypothetical protein